MEVFPGHNISPFRFLAHVNPSEVPQEFLIQIYLKFNSTSRITCMKRRDPKFETNIREIQQSFRHVSMTDIHENTSKHHYSE